jgi:transcriptional regulator with XRE-family HTH domain
MNWKLRAARISKGWSIEKASEMVNVAARTYQRWERGTHVPNFDSRRLLREAFGMTDEELGYAADPLLSSLDNQHNVSLTDEELTTLSELFSLMRRSAMANFDPAKRETLRKLLRLLENAGLTIGGFQLIDPEQIERLTGALRKPSCIDAKTLSGLRNTTVNYWHIRRYGTVASPNLLSAAREHYRIVTQLLQGSLFPTTRTPPLCDYERNGFACGHVIIDGFAKTR